MASASAAAVAAKKHDGCFLFASLTHSHAHRAHVDFAKSASLAEWGRQILMTICSKNFCSDYNYFATSEVVANCFLSKFSSTFFTDYDPNYFSNTFERVDF